MTRCEAWQAVQRLSKEEFIDRIRPQKLPACREELLFDFIQGVVKTRYSSQLDVSEYALKYLMSEIYSSIFLKEHLQSICEQYEYDPAKNGQNIIKHGIGFREVVSYSQKFGALTLIIPDKRDGKRNIIFSDLDLSSENRFLDFPPKGIKDLNYVISIAHLRDDRYRFISSRLISSKEKKYRKTIAQAIGDMIKDPQEHERFIDSCVDIIKRNLLPPQQRGNTDAT